jgi:hypothetical protein
MTSLIIVFIAAVPFVVWFLRRRTKRRGDEERAERRPTTSNPVVDKINTVIIEVERTPDPPASEQTEEELGKGATGAPEEGPAAVFDSDGSAQSPKEWRASAHQEIESHFPNEGVGAQLITRDPGSKEPLLSLDLDPLLSPPSIQTSLEQEETTTSIGVSDSSVEQIVSETAAPGNNLQADDTVPERDATQPPNQLLSNELPQSYADTEQAQPPQCAEESVGEDTTAKAPSRYRPPPQRPPRQPTARPVNQKVARSAPAELSLDIRIRLTFDRFGFCAIGLLPERTSELDSEVAVTSGGTSLRLVAQEDWYQDLPFENLGDHLRQGLELSGILSDNRRVRWLLKGRDVYVLASHQRASGFVSTTRLVLGRSHVVLCIVQLLKRVEAILSEAGCQAYTKLDQSHGVPSGWVGLRSVSPTRAIPLTLESDPFYALKPAPDIEIELEGGVCLRNSVWLLGYPPRIKLFGQPTSAVTVLIDGHQAQHTAEGALVADGYNLPGPHSVYCEGLSCSRSYSIEEPPDSWQVWPAYHFGQADICGPLVQFTPEATRRRVFSVPMSNPLLLGAEPGQIFRCSSRSVARWKGFVPFDVVWALPAQAFLCDKKSARILQFSNTPVAPYRAFKKTGLAWSNAILDAARKGLRVENGSVDSAARWRDYKKAARSIRRAAR